MVKHNHKHQHCEHEEVAYCGHCQVVYCKGCKREWSDCKRQHGPYYYSYPKWTEPIYCDTITTSASSDITWDAQIDHTATCSHSS